jgi:hypothetical protein
MTKRKIIPFGERIDKIICQCGEEIPLLPNAKAMGESIEIHVSLHMKGVKGSMCTILEANHLRDDLIIQVLRISGESEDEGIHE